MKSKTLGFSVVEVLVALGLLSVISLGVATVLVNSFKGVSVIESKVALMDLQNNIRSSLADQASWYNTVESANNPSLDCLKRANAATDYDCGAVWNVTSPIFKIMGGTTDDPTTAYDFTSPTKGFDKNGVPCNSFDEVNGNSSCPLRANVTWTPICASAASCKSPMVDIRINFTYKPGSSGNNLALNAARYNILVTKPGKTNSVDEACEALGGVIEPDGSCNINYCTAVGGNIVAGECVMPSQTQEACESIVGATFNPATGQCVVSDNLQSICASIPGATFSAVPAPGRCTVPQASLGSIGTCPAGQLLRGFNADGSRNCVTVSSLVRYMKPTLSAVYTCSISSDGTRTCDMGVHDICFITGSSGGDNDDVDAFGCRVSGRSLIVTGEDVNGVTCNARCIDWN